MATQGILSIVNEKGNVIFKAVAGATGFNVPDAANHFHLSKSIKTLDYVFKVCSEKGMQSLVVMDNKGGIKVDDFAWSRMDHIKDLPDEYFTKFKDPHFNPRWKNGTADYVEVVVIDGME